MQVRVAHLSFSPLSLHSVDCVMSCLVKAPNEMHSGWVILFEGRRIKFTNL